MSLVNIVRALGGDLYDGGRRANIPYPGHSRNDRSVSLLYDNGRVLATCFGDGTWQKALDDLREKGLIDYDHRPTSVVLSASSAGYQPPASKPERTAAARRLWEGGRPVRRTLAETHARLRRIRRDLPGDAVARFNRETPPLRLPRQLQAKNPAGAAPRSPRRGRRAELGRGHLFEPERYARERSPCLSQDRRDHAPKFRGSGRRRSAGNARRRRVLHHPLRDGALQPSRLGAHVHAEHVRVEPARRCALGAGRGRQW